MVAIILELAKVMVVIVQEVLSQVGWLHQC